MSVLRIPGYAFLAGTAAVGVLTLALMAPQWPLISTVLRSASFSLTEKVLTIGSLYGTLGTSLGLVGAGSLVGSSVLFGVNSALLAYLFSRRVRAGAGAFAGAGGLVTGALGVGCAACGSLVLTTVLSLGGAGAALTFLPLGGEELGLIGLGLLGWSAILLLRKVRNVHPLLGVAGHGHAPACDAARDPGPRPPRRREWFAAVAAVALGFSSWVLHRSGAGRHGYEVVARWKNPRGEGRIIALGRQLSVADLRTLGGRLREECRQLDAAVVMIFDDRAAAREVRRGSRVIGERRFEAALLHQRAMFLKQIARGVHRLVIYRRYPEILEVVRYA